MEDTATETHAFGVEGCGEDLALDLVRVRWAIERGRVHCTFIRSNTRARETGETAISVLAIAAVFSRCGEDLGGLW